MIKLRQLNFHSSVVFQGDKRVVTPPSPGPVSVPQIANSQVRLYYLKPTIFCVVVMASCEHSRSSAYSNDLRWRLVWQTLALQLPTKQVALNLSVDESTVRRTVRRFETTGTVDKKAYPSEKSFRKITKSAEFFILHLVMDRPSIYLRELRSELQIQLGIDVTESAICVFLHKAGFTKQRLKLYAAQRDDDLRAKFASDMSLFSTHMLLFLDETGTDNRDALRAKGYSLRGKPAKKQNILVRGEHVSAMCVMSMEGILTCRIVRGGVDGDKFIEFVENLLMPNVMPFNGNNSRSVVIMDNCAIHHVTEVTQLLQETGVLVYWLPPYSPDMNPIEEAFSKAKAMMRAMENEMQAINDIDTVVYSAFSTITSCDCEGWIADSGIYSV